MSYDISMNIGGELNDAEAARRIVMAIHESEMGSEYEFSFDGVDAILDHLSGGQGHSVNFCGRGDEDIADDILEACRAAGITYNVSVGYEGEDDYRFQRAWRLGMAEEATAGAADADHHVSLEQLNKAIAQAQASGDLGPVVALRDGVKAAHAEPGKLVVSPAVKERLAALDEDEWEEELGDASPTP
jgi:hypothetical protein